MLPPRRELIMVGMSAKTYRIGNIVRKKCRICDDDPGITSDNLQSCKNEADVYFILSPQPSIANCLSAGRDKDYVELEYYPNGNLKDYIAKNRATATQADLKRWALEMIQSIAYIHSKGVIHADLRLDQWLVDTERHARLCDFNSSGFDDQPHLGMKKRPAMGLESPSHFLPRDPEAESTVETDLFALGSCLYELVVGRKPYADLSDDKVEALFEEGCYPSTNDLFLGDIIMGCWKGEFSSAESIIDTLDFDTRIGTQVLKPPT